MNDPDVAVILFDSANPDYFLAHWDLTDSGELQATLPPGPTGQPPYSDTLIRLSKLPIITISAIRGRVRGAGSEFVLATDIRFASKERAVLGQFEMATGVLPGGGAPARLPRLVGRARAIEIIAGAEDFDGELAERYGYVNRAVADDEFEAFVHTFATRVSGFGRQAIEELKSFVDPLTLPSDDEFPPQTKSSLPPSGYPKCRDESADCSSRACRSPARSRRSSALSQHRPSQRLKTSRPGPRPQGSESWAAAGLCESVGEPGPAMLMPGLGHPIWTRREAGVG